MNAVPDELQPSPGAEEQENVLNAPLSSTSQVVT